MNKFQGETKDSKSKLKGRLLTLNHLKAETIEISKNTFKIGKGEGCDFQIDDQNVSETHFQISFRKGEILLTDFSAQGTYLNDSKIGNGNKVVIRNNDQIYLMPYTQCNDKDDVIGFLFKTQEGKQVKKKQLNTGKKETHQKQGQQLYDWLEDDIQCNICQECLFEPVILNPCNHHYCGACLSNWIKLENRRCPNCREAMKGIMKARTMNNIVEKYLQHHPEKMRTQEVIDEMKKDNLIYQHPERFIKFRAQGLSDLFRQLGLNSPTGSPITSDDESSEVSSDNQLAVDEEFQFFFDQPIEEQVRIEYLASIFGFMNFIMSQRRRSNQ